jgi:3-hydroxyacyl-CoA dehydrogenase/3-hydroxy-2-methylbutyryl-CoA dehydrogenase
VALVTGAASGLGRATAARIIQQGGRVVLCDVQTEKGLDTSREFGDRCEFVQTDVTSEADVVRALGQAEERFGAVNVAVNCAGIGIAMKTYHHKKKEVHPLDQYEKVLKVYIYALNN